MAKCYEQQEKLEECIQCLQRIVLIIEMSNVDGTSQNNEKMFTTMGHMAELYMLSGQTKIAKELLQKIEVSALESFGADSFERGRALMALAGCMDLMGDVTEAEATLLQAIALSGYGSCADESKKAVASNGFFNLGVILYKQNKFAAALPHFESALEFKVRGKVGAEDADMIETKKYIVESKQKCLAST
jgi:tetratricopeptide (TPR) repeat protein